MWRLFVIFPLLLSTMAIRVPVDDVEEGDGTEKDSRDTATDEKPTYYSTDTDEAAVDSYLVPPDPHSVEELPPGVKAPATYLVPPAPNQHSEYYIPIQEEVQTDWYPIQKQSAKNQAQRRAPSNPQITTSDTPNPVKVRSDASKDSVHIAFKMPSRQLEPPLENSPSSFAADEPAEIEIPVLERKRSSKITTPPVDLQLPLEKVNRNFNTNRDVPLHFPLLPAAPTLALHLTPPRPGLPGRNPTKLFPKKYHTFQPVPIPIAQFTDPHFGIPKARPLKHFKPVGSTESDYYPLDEEKKIYLFEQAEEKRRLKEEDLLRQQQNLDSTVKQAYADSETREQETSESNFRHPGRNSYPAPLRQAPPRAPAPQADAQGPPPPGERTEFRMHGMKGPHSYQFGYDTGKGKNRQFRFEERDNEGRVRGHYGYMEKDGKLRVVNYNADPESGFHAEAPEEKQA